MTHITQETHVNFNVLKLGTVCTDRATKLEGTLTHWVIDMDKRVDYIFQPKGLDENGLPVKKLLFGIGRLEVKETDFETVDVPFDILGSQVTDKASGFTGMAVQFIRHINGCFHVGIQPEGIVERTKLPISLCEFDLRQCTGEKIAELSGTELAQSKRDRPSPESGTFIHPLPSCVTDSVSRS